jgi:cytochrome P450
VDESKTGHFSFWLGKNHCVGVSGEAARKWFLDNRHFHRINGAILHGVGPEITPPIHQVFQMTYDKGHSFFQRRVLDFMKADHLARGLPYVIGDACAVFGALAKDPSGVIDPIDACYRLVLKQTARIVLADEVSDDPKKLDTYLYYTKILQHTHSGHTCAVPWLPSYEHWKRLYCRRGLKNLFTPVVSKRMEEGAPRGKDGLQVFLDNKDPVDWIITVFIAISFISVGNAGKLSGGLLNLMANHPDWQEKIYAEIKATAQAHSANKDAPLVQQLDSLPFEAWESISPLIDLCVAESIRMHVAFPMTRQNIAPTALTIPGTNQVVPSGSFIVYNTGDAHFNEKLYPNHMKMDPNRFGEGHGEFKKESYGCTYSRVICFRNWREKEKRKKVSYFHDRVKANSFL